MCLIRRRIRSRDRLEGLLDMRFMVECSSTDVLVGRVFVAIWYTTVRTAV